MQLEGAIIQFAETAGRELISAESAFYEAEALDDGEHIPRLGRIVQAIATAASMAGAADLAATDLKQRLLLYAEDEYLRHWMDSLEADEDPEDVREAGVREFRGYLGRELRRAIQRTGGRA